jgi:hypothetical protein
MKKLYTFLVLCLIGVMGAWAEKTLVYGRALTADETTGVSVWSSSDVGSSAWNGNASYDAEKGIYMSGNGSRVTAQTFTLAANAKLTIDIAWNTMINTGDGGNYSYINIGDNIAIQSNQQNQNGAVIINGTSYAISNANGKNNGNRNNDVWNIHAEINTATSSLDVLTVTGTSGTNKASYTLATATTLNGSMSGGVTITMGVNRVKGSISTALQAISVYEEAQEVTTVGYTINYIFDKDTINQVKNTIAVGATVNAVSPITIDGAKYYAADGAATSMKTTSDATANVLNVNLRKALTKTVSIIAVDGEGNELKRFSTECIEGEAAKNLFYTRAVEKDGEYYTIAAANANGMNYGKSVSYTSSDENKIYTLDKSITYYAEESDLNVTRSYAAQGQAPERGSGGNWQRLYANSYAYTDALPAGVYKLDISGRSQSASSNSLDIDVRLADGTLVKTGNTVTWDNAVCSVQTFEGINVPEGASIVINNAIEYNTNVALDYVIAYRTGDATEQITINDIGVSSYVTTYPLDFSNLTGVKALIATSETEDQIVMTKVTEVPANTPIIVRGTAGTYDVPVGSCTALPSTNLLKGSATESINAGDEEGTVYALKKSDGEFHKVAATVTIPAKIAYFVSTATTAGAKEIKSYTIFGEEETAVSSVNADTEKANVRLFNVAGQQVGAGYKGLVIDENGNKYIK